MDENEKIEVNQETTGEQNAPAEIVIEQPGKARKILKWVVGGLVLVASTIGGILLGKNLGKDDETSDESADAESPKED